MIKNLPSILKIVQAAESEVQERRQTLPPVLRMPGRKGESKIVPNFLKSLTTYRANTLPQPLRGVLAAHVAKRNKEMKSDFWEHAVHRAQAPGAYMKVYSDTLLTSQNVDAYLQAAAGSAQADDPSAIYTSFDIFTLFSRI